MPCEVARQCDLGGQGPDILETRQNQDASASSLTPLRMPHMLDIAGYGIVHMLNPIDRYDVFIGHNSILQLAIDIGQS